MTMWTMPNSSMKKFQDDLLADFLKRWREQGMSDNDIFEHLQRVNDEYFKRLKK